MKTVKTQNRVVFDVLSHACSYCSSRIYEAKLSALFLDDDADQRLAIDKAETLLHELQHKIEDLIEENLEMVQKADN
ncbi:hypothetical protein [Dipodfec virus UOA04_Rod_881]|nr:hypothetical protein [Dipodfec virus UOA04_Rod_881]